ncbi:MAG: hypothetical protein ACYDH1_01570 [Anaerolineaceae bacterium]
MRTYKLTEEIARWAFEVRCMQSKCWFVAFTNPTAGPWKSVKAFLIEEKSVGEIHRFRSAEERPDIVLINDELKLVIIIEAKDSIAKLTAPNQAEKSAKVVRDMAKVFNSLSSNQYWKGRQDHKVIVGLLWGAETKTSDLERKRTFKLYLDQMNDCPDIDTSTILGIETFKTETGKLTCDLYYCLGDQSRMSIPEIEIIAHSLDIIAYPC